MTRATALKRARRILNVDERLFRVTAGRTKQGCEIRVHRVGGGLAGRVSDTTWERVLQRIRP